MSKVKVLVVVKGGVCQEVFLELDGVPREDVQIGVIDWDELEFGTDEDHVGYLVDELDTKMDAGTKLVADRIFSGGAVSVGEYSEWEAEEEAKKKEQDGE